MCSSCGDEAHLYSYCTVLKKPGRANTAQAPTDSGRPILPQIDDTSVRLRLNEEVVLESHRLVRRLLGEVSFREGSEELYGSEEHFQTREVLTETDWEERESGAGDETRHDTSVSTQRINPDFCHTKAPKLGYAGAQTSSPLAPPPKGMNASFIAWVGFSHLAGWNLCNGEGRWS